MTGHIRFLTLAVAAVGSLAFAGISAAPASASTGFYYITAHGYGPTQYDAQQDAEYQIDYVLGGGNGCARKGSDHYTPTSTGWEDTLAGICQMDGT
jgi:hypothetical protein